MTILNVDIRDDDGKFSYTPVWEHKFDFEFKNSKQAEVDHMDLTFGDQLNVSMSYQQFLKLKDALGPIFERIDRIEKLKLQVLAENPCGVIGVKVPGPGKPEYELEDEPSNTKSVYVSAAKDNPYRDRICVGTVTKSDDSATGEVWLIRGFWQTYQSIDSIRYTSEHDAAEALIKAYETKYGND